MSSTKAKSSTTANCSISAKSSTTANSNTTAKSSSTTTAISSTSAIDKLMAKIFIMTIILYFPIRYAWVVAALMWISNVCTAGYIKSFGITYNALLELYPDTSAGAGSIIVGLLAGCRSLLGWFHFTHYCMNSFS